MNLLFSFALSASLLVHTGPVPGSPVPYTASETAHTEYLRILSAASEEWVAGVKDGGRGTDYFFRMKVNTSQKVRFDSVWVNNRSFATFLSNETGSLSDKPVTFRKGDVITLKASDAVLPGNEQTAVNSRAPIRYKGAALIRYYVNGKAQYLVVREIKKRKGPNRA